jgi:hypothetical protein
MNRLELISQINPTWAVNIYSFIEAYPEFAPYTYLAPIHQTEPIPYKNVNTLFEAIMHYICAAGVRYTYAINQWQIIYSLICCNEWNTIIDNFKNIHANTSIQNKKRDIYYKLLEYMNNNNLNHKNINMRHLELLKENVSGIGDGCIAWCKKYFTSDDECVEYTDINFKKGFEKIYNTNSIAQRKQKAKEWQQHGFGRIGNLMVIQIGGYT